MSVRVLSNAARARVWFHGASRWLWKKDGLIRTRIIGANPYRGLETRIPGCWSSGSRPARTAPTAPAGCSLGTRRGISYSRRCIKPVLPAARAPRTSMTDCACRICLSPRFATAPHPTINPHPKRSAAADIGFRRIWTACRMLRGSSCSGKSR